MSETRSNTTDLNTLRDQVKNDLNIASHVVEKIKELTLNKKKK